MRSPAAATLVPVMLAVATVAWADGVSFSAKPDARKAGDNVKITFAVSGPTDVEVAVLDAGGKVVHHLAAGVLGGKIAPPAPLKAGLAQELVWEGKDDLGRPAGAGPFTVRVRAGIGAKLCRAGRRARGTADRGPRDCRRSAQPITAPGTRRRRNGRTHRGDSPSTRTLQPPRRWVQPRGSSSRCGELGRLGAEASPA
jgi:hypothetical protein